MPSWTSCEENLGIFEEYLQAKFLKPIGNEDLIRIMYF
jgi:hypothetical protein